ncbi:hypothetical protein FRC18_006460 [Serendipita sp. 400]|nr:hypothetical protein FRC18_006460 [Serendipita sp. 400]
MDYFAKFLSIQPPVKQPQDHFAEFTKSWQAIKNTLTYPDERQLNRGIRSTDVPARLRSMGDALIHESASSDFEEYCFLLVACLDLTMFKEVLGRAWNTC